MLRTILLVLFCCIASSIAKPVNVEELQMEVPDTWQKLDMPPPFEYAARDPQSGATIQIALMRFSPPATSLDDSRVEKFKKGFTEHASRVISEHETQISGRPAVRLELETIKPSGPFVLTSWLVPANAGIYAIIAEGNPDLPSTQALIKSVQFTPSASDQSASPAPKNGFEKLGMFLFYAAIVVVILAILRPRRRRK